MKIQHLFVLALILMHGLTAASQVDYARLDVDELFQIARQKAFDGQKAEARIICDSILARSPGYSDVRILKGRTFSWDGMRNEARKEFYYVIDRDPGYVDATLALADVEVWDDKPQAALDAIDHALKFAVRNEELLLKRVNILISIEKFQTAMEYVTYIETLNPSCTECVALRKKIRINTLRYSVNLSYNLDYFSDVYNPMHYYTLQGGVKTKMGSLLGRINYSERFGDNGIQPEVDFYPRLFRRTYAYLNYGFSSSDVYPAHRVGVEIYRSLPRSYEASLGIRYLDFGTSTVMIYTGTIGKYIGNYWFMFRPFITPSNVSFSRSLTVSARRFFGDNPDNYFSLNLGAGFSPDIRKLLNNKGLDSNTVYFLESQKIETTYQKAIGHFTVITMGVDCVRQELIFSHGGFVYIWSFTAGYKRRF